MVGACLVLAPCKVIQIQLKSSFTSLRDSVVNVLEHDKENQPLCKAIMDLASLKHDLSLRVEWHSISNWRSFTSAPKRPLTVWMKCVIPYCSLDLATP